MKHTHTCKLVVSSILIMKTLSQGQVNQPYKQPCMCLSKSQQLYILLFICILSIFSYTSEKIKVSWGILSLYIFDMLVSFWESIQTQRKSVNVPPHFPFAQPDEIFGPSGGLKRLEGYMYETKNICFQRLTHSPLGLITYMCCKYWTQQTPWGYMQTCFEKRDITRAIHFSSVLIICLFLSTAILFVCKSAASHCPGRNWTL